MKLLADYLCGQILGDLKRFLKWLWKRLPKKLLYDIFKALIIELIKKYVLG